MWCMIDSLRFVVDGLSGAFTCPSFATAGQLLLGWIMCLGKHTLRRSAQSAQPQTPPVYSPLYEVGRGPGGGDHRAAILCTRS